MQKTKKENIKIPVYEWEPYCMATKRLMAYAAGRYKKK
jgi:hypothetical protein